MRLWAGRSLINEHRERTYKKRNAKSIVSSALMGEDWATDVGLPCTATDSAASFN